MSEAVHEIVCKNCESALLARHVFYLELITSEARGNLTSLAHERDTPIVCPECEHENTIDLPFSVFDPQVNRLYHYMPATSFSGMDVTEMFDFAGDATPTLVGVVIGHLQSTGALSSGVLEYQMHQPSFSFRTFFSAYELVLQVGVGAQIVAAHQAKAQRLKDIEPPAEFLKRGSRLYKRNKLKFIYGLGQGFEEGYIYNESDVARIIQHGRQYFRENQIDDSHARVALVELGLLERTSCGRFYWRKPEAARIHGLNFPARIEGFEKCGYVFYEEPDPGFSVNYQSNALESRVSFYVYGAPDLAVSPETIEREFSTTKDGMLEHFQAQGQSAEVLEEKRLTRDDLNGRAETVCHLTLRITDPSPDEWFKNETGNDPKNALRTNDLKPAAYRSHFLLTAWGGRFIKVRMTSPDAIVKDDEVLFRVVAALFQTLANRQATTPSIAHQEMPSSSKS